MRPMLRGALTGWVALAVAGCGDGARTVAGTLREDEGAERDALSVRVGEAGEPVPILGGAFELRELPDTGVLVLHFERDGRTRASLRIDELDSGATLTLDRVRLADGGAFPSEVRIEGGRTALLNGLRWGNPKDLPDRIDQRGVILAVDRDAEALLLRVADAATADLRVVLTPGTEVATADGDPVDGDALEEGDTVRVVGETVRPYVVAQRVEVARRAALGASSAEGGEALDGDTEGDDGVGAERASGSAGAASAGAAAAAATPSTVREPRGLGRDRGKGREKRRGKKD